MSTCNVGGTAQVLVVGAVLVTVGTANTGGGGVAMLQNQVVQELLSFVTLNKNYLYFPLTYGMGIPARRGADRSALPYSEGIKAKINDKNLNTAATLIIFVAAILLQMFQLFDIAHIIETAL